MTRLDLHGDTLARYRSFVQHHVHVSIDAKVLFLMNLSKEPPKLVVYDRGYGFHADVPSLALLCELRECCAATAFFLFHKVKFTDQSSFVLPKVVPCGRTVELLFVTC